MKKIVLLCDSYPSIVGESFLAEEMNYIDYKVDVFPYHLERNGSLYEHDLDKIKYHVRENKMISNFKKIKIFFKALVNKTIYQEIFYLWKNRRFTFYKWKQMVYFYYDTMEYVEWIQSCLDSGDEILFYSYWLYVQGFAAIKLKEKYKNSIAVSRCHGFDLYEERHCENYIPFRNVVLQEMDRVFAVSEQGKEYLLERYGSVFSDKIEVANLGVKNWMPNYVSRRKKNELAILTCSSLIPLKRVDKVLDTLSSITDMNITWYHIGTGQLIEGLIEKSRLLSPNIKCVFLGYMSQTEIKEFYVNTNVDLFINVSETEGKPVSIMEACCCYKPIIATRVGGVPEMVVDGYNGYLLNIDFDHQELKELLSMFYHMSQDAYEVMCMNSKSMWERNFDLEKNYSSFYKEILSI